MTVIDFEKVFSDLSVGDERVRIFRLMEVLGLDTIRVNYTGGGDSGSIEEIEFHPEVASNRKIYEFIRDRFEETLSDPVWNMHGSFADGGGYSVDGVVVWDAKGKDVSIRGTHHYYECDEDGEETENHDEDFEEACFNWEEGDPDRDEPSYEMLYVYAKFILKDRFPGEYHNRMVAAAMASDVGAVEYVKWCESGCK